MSRLRDFGRVVLFSAGVSLLTGCHTYRAVDDPPIGSVVRVRVPVTSPLSDLNRAPETISIDGRLLENGDTIAVATETRREMGAYRELVQFDTLRLAASQTSSLELREFSTRRSVVLGVTVAGAAGYLAAVALGLVGGESGDEGTPPLPETAVISRSLLSSVWGLITR